ncbi:MAG: hypothetical protein EA397_05445 [Deltaproteobacteria bacterium]|nr:MAG: hypothetical protein EA397_05445 [Deltaproteobacteria bacterium]
MNLIHTIPALALLLSTTIPVAQAGGTSDVAIVETELPALGEVPPPAAEEPRERDGLDRTKKWAQGGLHVGLNGPHAMVGASGSLSSDRLYVGAEAGLGLNVIAASSRYARAGLNVPIVVDNDTQVRVQGMAGRRRYNPGMVELFVSAVNLDEGPERLDGTSFTATFEVTHWTSERTGVSFRGSMGAVRYSDDSFVPELGLTAGFSF